MSAADFVSVNSAGADGPRLADGSLPVLGLLKPRAGGALIDRGVNVGLPYLGQAPELGAYEYAAMAAGFGQTGTAKLLRAVSSAGPAMLPNGRA